MANKDFKTLDIFDDDNSGEGVKGLKNEPLKTDNNTAAGKAEPEAERREPESGAGDNNSSAGKNELQPDQGEHESLNDEDNLLVFSSFKKGEDTAVELFAEEPVLEAAQPEAPATKPQKASAAKKKPTAGKKKKPAVKDGESSKEEAAAAEPAPESTEHSEASENEAIAAAPVNDKTKKGNKKFSVKAIIDNYTSEESRQRREAAKEERMAIPIVTRTVRFIGYFALVSACLAVIIGSAVMAMLSIYIVNVTSNDGDLIKDYALSYTTILYAKNSETNEYTETQRLYGSENRIWVNYSEMPDHLIKAAIAIEDQHFLENDGVDWKRTIAAALNEVLHIWPNMQGGSTITQQLVKNITNDKAVDSVSGILRKMREIYRALTLNSQHSKDEIMEAYLNTIRLSGQYAGVEAGANAYFNCHTKDLTICQSAALVAVTNSPYTYSPLSNPENNRERREYILQLMLEQGKITKEEYDAAMLESANLITTASVDEAGNYIIPRDQLIATSANSTFDWFTDMVVNDVMKDLVELKGYTSAQASNLMYNGGLRIYTTKDQKIQDIYTRLAVDDLWPEYYDDEGNRQQAAMITMNMTGEIVGLMGKLGEKNQSLIYNIATDGVRQIGSAMKPLGVYGPAMEMNAITYSSLFEDQPIVINNGGRLENYPVNYWKKYGDPITVARAIADSFNTVPVRILRMISFEYSYAYLSNMLGITSLDPERDLGYSSLALGGLTYGISLKEATAAYIPFSNGGMYYEPHSYTKVTAANGDTIIDKTSTIKTVRAYSSETAMIMNKLLQLVIREGSATNAQYGSMPLAGKTGTTTDEADFLFFGSNPYYVTGVWMGYEYKRGTTTRQPGTSRVAFKYLMSEASADLPYKNFPVAGSVITAQYCKVSGCIASADCPDKLTGYYKPGHVPETCRHGLYVTTEEKAEADAQP